MKDYSNSHNSKKVHTLPHLATFRTQLRKKATPAEAYLWTFLQSRKLNGKKFRRQHSIGNYIVDFYCAEELLAVELDGNGHDQISQQQYDEERDLFISFYNIKVIRFENKQVFDNLDFVLNEITTCLKKT
jgi:very-short-patch-repair endonuclease